MTPNGIRTDRTDRTDSTRPDRFDRVDRIADGPACPEARGPIRSGFEGGDR